MWIKAGLLLVCIFAIVSVNGLTCDQKLAEAEEGVKTLILMSDKVKLPKDVPEMKKYCSLTKGSLRSLKTYTTCLTAFPKQVFSVLIGSLNKLIKQYCGKNSNPADVVKQIRCYTPELIEKKVYDKVDDVARQFQYIATNMSVEQAVPGLCCSVHLLRVQLYETVFKNCGEGKEDGANFMAGIMETLFDDINKLICTNNANLNECKKNSAKMTEKMDSIAKNKPKGEELQFFVRPLITVANKLVE